MNANIKKTQRFSKRKYDLKGLGFKKIFVRFKRSLKSKFLTENFYVT